MEFKIVLMYENGLKDSIKKYFDNYYIALQYANKAKRIFNAKEVYVL